MSRTKSCLTVLLAHHLEPAHHHCPICGKATWVAYQTKRTLTRLERVYRLTLTIRRCHNTQCPQFHQPCRPEEEGAWALPHGEFGLDIIALVGNLRYV